MSLRKEQCKKVCRILDDVLANRPTERDSLIVAVRKAFESLEQFGNSEPLPSAEPERKKGEWIELGNSSHNYICSLCGRMLVGVTDGKNRVAKNYPFCHCGADMRGGHDEGTEHI